MYLKRTKKFVVSLLVALTLVTLVPVSVGQLGAATHSDVLAAKKVKAPINSAKKAAKYVKQEKGTKSGKIRYGTMTDKVDGYYWVKAYYAKSSSKKANASTGQDYYVSKKGKIINRDSDQGKAIEKKYESSSSN